MCYLLWQHQFCLFLTSFARNVAAFCGTKYELYCPERSCQQGASASLQVYGFSGGDFFFFVLSFVDSVLHIDTS